MDKIEQTSQYLKTLLLPVIRKEFEKIAERARKEQFDYVDYLLELAEAEVEERSQKRCERWLKESNLPRSKTLSSFEMSRLPKNVMQQCKVLLQGKFVEKKENILLFGSPGGGKTHLMCAIAQGMIQQGYRCYYRTCSGLLQDLLLAKKELRLNRLIKKLIGYDLLAIDEIGYVQQEKEEMEVLFVLLAACYEQTSVMLTSNLPFSKWEKIFKDAMMAAAAIDRLVHHSVILEINVESYRLKASKKEKEAPNPS